MQKKSQQVGPSIPPEMDELIVREETGREASWLVEKQSAKGQPSSFDGTELFSKFTADIIKEDVLFTR